MEPPRQIVTDNSANNLTGDNDSIIQSSQESDQVPSAQVYITDEMEEDDRVDYKRTQAEMKDLADVTTAQTPSLSTITPNPKRPRPQEVEAERDAKAESSRQ